MDDDLIMEIWDTFKEYIPEKNRDTAANHYVDYLLGKDISVSTLEGFIGYDTHLDDAIQTVVDENNQLNAEDEYDDYEDYDDEDY